MLKTNKTNEIFPFREVKTPPRLKGNCGTANALVIAGSRVKIQQHSCALSLIVNENCADKLLVENNLIFICLRMHHQRPNYYDLISSTFKLDLKYFPNNIFLSDLKLN
uniref:Uncharacterized protein n=1 Tax=Glossina austeni TaxID=7395 RepID=A0A1A9VTY6_GLOAU